MATDREEGPTTLDVPSLAKLKEWQEARADAAPAAPPLGAAQPLGPAPGAPSAAAAPQVPYAPETALPGSRDGPPITDWMSPEEVDAALAVGKPAAKRPPRAAPPRNPHTARSGPPPWLVPVICAGAFVVFFGTLALVLLLGR